MEKVMDSVSLYRRVADIFAEDSENDQTFHGFSDSEISDLLDVKRSDSDSASGTRTTAPPHFQLRVSLRSQQTAAPSSEEEEEEEEKEEEKMKKGRKVKEKKMKGNVKEEMEEVKLMMMACPGSGSDSEEPKSFLDKRAQNIKANKAMLSRLMADLQQMPGGERLLKNQEAKRLKEKTRVPRSVQARAGSRRNPERMSRRRTRSMGPEDDSAAPPEQELELSLEDELLEVRGTHRRRSNPRPYQGKPHTVRPVEDVTEEELELVADSLTEKVYSSSMGTTCHQCRQKTVDTKTCCRSEQCRGVQGQFCGPCLKNRYGENVKTALLDPVRTLVTPGITNNTTFTVAVTHSHIHTHIPSHTLSHSHSLLLSHTLTIPLSHTLSHSHTHSLTLPLSPSLTLPKSPSRLRSHFSTCLITL